MNDRLSLKDVEASTEPQTKWKFIIVAAVVNLISTIESTIIINAQWPYLNKLDSSVSPTFMGYINASSKASHAIFAVLFGALVLRTKKLRSFIITGRMITLIACSLFISAERMPSLARYLIFTSYVLFSIGDSSLMLLRGYVASVSSEVDRALAFATLAMANVLSMIFGAGGLLIISTIFKSRNLEIFGASLHLYDISIAIVIMLNVVAITLTKFGFTDYQQMDDHHIHSTKSNESHWQQFKRLPAFLILLCFFEKIVVSSSLTTAITTTSPMCTEVFGWGEAQTIGIMSGSNTAIGILALITVTIFMLGKIGNKVAAWKIFLFCIFMFFVFFFGAYPHAFMSQAIDVADGMNSTGCKPEKYDWCYDTVKPSPYLYFSLLVISFGIFFPLSTISLDTVYSKVLGSIDQSFFQSAIIAADDVFQILCPFIITHSFEFAGQPLVFALGASLCAFGIVTWLLNISMLRKKTRDENDVGEPNRTASSTLSTIDEKNALIRA